MQKNPMQAYTPRSFSSHSLSSQKKSRKWTSEQKELFKKRILLFCGLIFLGGLIGGISYFQTQILRDLPDVSQVKNMVFSQATVITDRNGVELYKIFDENREYVSLDDINENMINAIIAIEDQRYRDHEGLDPMGIFRAGIKTMLGKKGGGASTIPQQLITNVFNLKRGIGRGFFAKINYKLKQIVLSKKLNVTLQKQIKEENKKLSGSEVKTEMKRKILELYLNYVFLGNNSYGVEAASKMYFSKSAKELDILESAVLASIPNGPAVYNPYSPKKLMGYFQVSDDKGDTVPFEGNIRAAVISEYIKNVEKAKVSDKKSNNAFVKFMVSLAPSSVSLEGKTYSIKYINGRTLLTLTRMFEDGMIGEDEAKEAFLNSLTLTFQSSTFDIKSPHFVFWVKDLLEKEFGEEIVKEGGLVVTTTLDYEIQKIAEESLTSNVATFFEYGASNGSLIYTDTNNGDILAYVGSLNYFNEAIEGQNDMVRRPRQSGSAIKPLIYALGFLKLPLTIDTPIYDIPFSVGKDTPSNADGKFDGMIPLRVALGNSRNIPMVKLFLALGGESVAKPFLQKLGLSGIKDSIEYGYPLSLGAGEVSMLELAGAYSHLTREEPAVIDPILEIRTSDGKIIYEKETKFHEKTIDAGVISLLWKILATPSNRLAGWVGKFNVAGFNYALKSGTSNVVTENGSRPRDGWLAGYTPSKVVLMRAGNADASPMNRSAYGGNIHEKSIKLFWNKLLEQNYISNEEIPMKNLSSVNISRVSGKLAGENTPQDLVVSSFGWNGHLPAAIEGPISQIEIDNSCFGKASPLTPAENILKGYLISPSSFMPNNMDLEDIKEWNKASYISSGENQNKIEGLIIFNEEPKTYCENRAPMINTDLTLEFIELQNEQNFAPKNTVIVSVKSNESEAIIKKLTINVDGTSVGSKTVSGREIFESINVDLSNFTEGKHDLELFVMDENQQINSKKISINLITEDHEAPILLRDKSSVTQTEEDYQVNLFFVDNASSVKGGKIFAAESDKAIHTFKMQIANFTTTSKEIVVEVEDLYGNILKESLDLENF